MKKIAPNQDPDMTPFLSDNKKRQINAAARRALMMERAGFDSLNDSFQDTDNTNSLAYTFPTAVQKILEAQGHIIITGIGKSGHVGSKIAATLSSTGTPATFMHAAEASHGDLGMITEKDVIVAISWSGESTEFSAIITYAKRFKVPLIAMTRSSMSSLGRQSDIALILPTSTEACPHKLAPTTSTLMQLALGDALAIALLEQREFTPTDFGTFHPGGKLGAQLRHVEDIMHRGDEMPLAHKTTKMDEAIILMSEKGFGCVGVLDDDDNLIGIVTDGDLRRHMNKELLEMELDAVMTTAPRTVSIDTLASAALEIMNSAGKGIQTLFVTTDNKPVGIINLHDLLRIGVA